MRGKLNAIIGMAILTIPIFYMALSALTKEEPAVPPSQDRVQIRWFVGLEIDSDLNQIAVLEEVASEFNTAQDEIELVLDIATIDGAYDMFSTQISTGYGPDIVGPISWGTAVGFPDQWLVLDPYITESDFDTTGYTPALLEFYQTEAGTISLPFAVYPSAIFYVSALFDEVGLAYPPQVYGEGYVLNGRIVPWNWQTLSQIAQLLTLDANGYNATQPEFDRSHIVQVGFDLQGQSATAVASFFGAAKMYAGDRQGNYVSTIPENWRTGWQWWREGIWGQRPFMASGTLANADEFGRGNIMNAGRAAMTLSQSAYVCCLHELREFQIGVLPESEEGMVNGRIAETSFYIWQGTAHPHEAFTVLTYILTTASHKLLPAYTAMPAIPIQTDTFIAQQSSPYPAVTPASWHVLVQSLAYPDNPSADQYLPNRNEAFNRLQIFSDLLVNSKDLDFATELQKLQDDLTRIYNK